MWSDHMAGFAKLSSNLVTSSLWSCEDDQTRIMFITMLALADAKGFVSGTLPGMADMARVSAEDAERALSILEGPDPYSRTPDDEGRRIRKVPGGWILTGYVRHRNEMSKEARAEAKRNWDRKNRPSGSKRAKSDTVRHGPTIPTQAEAEAEAEAEATTEAEEEETSLFVQQQKKALGEIAIEKTWVGAKDKILSIFSSNNTIRKALSQAGQSIDVGKGDMMRRIYVVCHYAAGDEIQDPAAAWMDEFKRHFKYRPRR